MRKWRSRLPSKTTNQIPIAQLVISAKHNKLRQPKVGYQNLLKSSRSLWKNCSVWDSNLREQKVPRAGIEPAQPGDISESVLNSRVWKLCPNTVCSTVWTLTQNFRHLNREKHCLNSDPAVTLYCLKHCPWQLCSKLGILPFLMITVWTLLYENSVLITVSTVLGHWIIYCYFSVLTVKNHCCMKIFKCAWAVFG